MAQVDERSCAIHAVSTTSPKLLTAAKTIMCVAASMGAGRASGNSNTNACTNANPMQALE
jgi:hypothetical protein